MNLTKFQKCCICIAALFMVVSVAIVFEMWQRDMAFRGPPSKEQTQRLVGSIAGWSIFSILPAVPMVISWIRSRLGGLGGNASELGSLVNAVEALLNMFGGGKFSASYIIELFRTMGLPVWFYIGISWGSDKTYAGGFGRVPDALPPPPPPPPPNPTVIVKTVAPASPAPATASATAGTANP